MNDYSLSINMAMTIDGKVMRPDGKWYGLSSRKDKARMDTYRANSEILILGKNSILNDNPVIQLRYEIGNSPKPVILIRKGTIPNDRRVFKTSIKPIIFCTELNYKELIDSFSDSSDVYSIGVDSLEPKNVLEKLISMGYSNFLLEGGPTLNYSFFNKDLVTRIYLTIVPFIIGKSNLFSIVNGELEFPNFDKNNWILKKNETIENEIFLCYEKKQ